MKGVNATFGGDFQIRWTAAEKKAIANIIKHYQPLIGALTEMGSRILENGEEGPFFKDDNIRNKANGMVRDLTDKNLMFLHFLLDILDVIETASLEFQKRYGLLVDQAKNLESLTSSLIKIGNHNRGHYVQKFLKECNCEDEPCGSLMTYEMTEEVEFKGIVLRINKKRS